MKSRLVCCGIVCKFKHIGGLGVYIFSIRVMPLGKCYLGSMGSSQGVLFLLNIFVYVLQFKTVTVSFPLLENVAVHSHGKNDLLFGSSC